MSADTDALGKCLSLGLCSLEKETVLAACSALQESLGFSTLAKIIHCGILSIRSQLTIEDLEKARKAINQAKKDTISTKPQAKSQPLPAKSKNPIKIARPFDDNNFPDDLIISLFNYLDHKSHVSFANVSKRMLIISRNPSSLLKFGLHFESYFYMAYSA